MTEPDEYLEFLAAVKRITGIDLTQYKRQQMERRIRSFVERRDSPSLPAYAEVLRRDSDEVRAFLDRVTINVSQLYRNPEQWQSLRTVVIPQLAQAGRIRAWSAGSSYGAEAYTLAGVLKEAAPSCRSDVLGTDIDQTILARARTGTFSDADARSMPREMLERWFVPATDAVTNGPGWQAKPEIMRLVRFERGDLLTMTPRADAHDLILCRNVVIYFDQDVRDRVHENLAASLRAGGFLMVGSTERVSDARGLGLTMVEPFIYRKGE